MIDRRERSYRIFGGVLRTSLQVPELHEAPPDQSVNWSLSFVDGSEIPQSKLPEIAAVQFRDGRVIKLFRGADGATRLTLSDYGTFDVVAGGSEILWYRPAGVHTDIARSDVLGVVLSLAAHSTGLLMLHASAVAINDTVVGFVAPKFYGKSTLACALTDAGARLVTDDALAMRSGARVECAPGVPAIRLRTEAAAHLRGAVPEDDQTGVWRHVERREIEDVAYEWLPLAALYILVPRTADQPEAAIREQLAGPPAAVSLVQHAKLGSLLRGPLAIDYLDWATAVATVTPVYQLAYVRDLNRLPEVAQQIIHWHSGESTQV